MIRVLSLLQHNRISRGTKVVQRFLNCYMLCKAHNREKDGIQYE